MTFFRPFNPILAVTTGESMRIPGSTPTLSVIYRKWGHANQAVHRNQVASEWVKKISIWSWVELHFTTISYTLSFNYSYRYEINLIQIMYTANSSILYSKEKTVQILGTWHQYSVNVLAFVIPFLGPDFFKYLHFKYKKVSLKISHITYPFLSSNFTAQ